MHGGQEDRLEKAVAVGRRPSQLLANASDGALFDDIAEFIDHQLTQFAPPLGIAGIDEGAHALLAECQECLCGAWLGDGQQRDGRHARKLTHQPGHLGRVLRLVARHRDEDGRDGARAQIDHQFIEGLAMQCDIAAVPGGVDALPFHRREQGGNRRVRGAGTSVMRRVCRWLAGDAIAYDVACHGSSS